eukprot:TRINITY_DN20588_c0_g1_i1.p1 TRINITY_DN20588_c0_g1~~TRINITY_DN20588_c0_g1_i1.p1  ORF type:complete len:225 (-),score=28.11 TRINITY_DN20588_c0_g1_i1:308-982(-)
MALSSSTSSLCCCSYPSLIAASSVSHKPCKVSVRSPSHPRPKTLAFLRLSKTHPSLRGSTRLNAAGLTEIEPDLPEGKVDLWGTGGISSEEFVYGEYDGHHTYHEGNEGTFWEGLVADYEAAEPPKGFQGFISWLFLPAIVAGLAYQVPGEYLYIGAAIFVVVFCGIEIAKPDKPHHFPPEIYNMEREARDKFIAECNTMDIWDFSDELWDFTVKKINGSSKDD